MQKLISHIVVAASLWFGLGHFGLGTPWKIAAIVAGAFAVHFVWERLLPYSGVMPVAPDDPLMQEARRLAAESMPRLRALFPDHRRDTVVRFGLPVKTGKREFVWGDLLELNDTTAKVFIRTPPVDEPMESERTLTIAVSEIDDWQIVFPDDTLRGGFTNRAVFRIMERDGILSPGERKMLERFRDD